MPTTDDDRTHEALGQAECLRLLGTAGIGRLAYTEAALPAIRPVSFSVRGDDVLVPVRRESSLVAAMRGAVVAFEADDYDPGTRTGWAVTVVGHSRVLEGEGVEGRSPSTCVIAVQVGLVEGWRTTARV
jgi:nitroimidazol reductase NimA-like FMN-containing flavoprotein (pyridoxamine 5'-phosphate oxidase superfamily)